MFLCNVLILFILHVVVRTLPLNYHAKNYLSIPPPNSGLTFVKAGKRKKKIFLENDDLPINVRKLDLKEKYIIPGLIDMHCHIREKFARHFIAAGVTTVRNTAGDLGMLQPLIDAPLDSPTPSVYSTDWLIDGEPGLWGPTGEGNCVTDDPEVVRREVQRQ